ncbi:hypothetical protein C8Q72DRAFT_153898 [Fomitopsis betulina]|nr:hypothetical protein C8Q72DRAFT_153898 [Fomitopsis betulina]
MGTLRNRSASLEALRKRKAHHYQCIRAINTEMNALAPISILPPELLSNIFLDVAGRGSADPALWDPEAVDYWIHVTHVCTSWREVALQCTLLWSYLDLPIPSRILEELLARSRDAPLSIKLRFSHLEEARSLEMKKLWEDALLLGLSALHRLDIHI